MLIFISQRVSISISLLQMLEQVSSRGSKIGMHQMHQVSQEQNRQNLYRMIYESKMKEIVLICFDLNNQNACFKYDGENLSEFVSSNEYHYQARLGHYKVGCVFRMDHRRWSFGPNSACCSIETTIIRNMHSTLKISFRIIQQCGIQYFYYGNCLQFTF